MSPPIPSLRSKEVEPGGRCNTCNYATAFNSEWVQHVASPLHQSKTKAKPLDLPQPKTQSVAVSGSGGTCALCNFSTPSSRNWAEHTAGKKHQKKIKLLMPPTTQPAAVDIASHQHLKKAQSAKAGKQKLPATPALAGPRLQPRLASSIFGETTFYMIGVDAWHCNVCHETIRHKEAWLAHVTGLRHSRAKAEASKKGLKPEGPGNPVHTCLQKPAGSLEWHGKHEVQGLEKPEPPTFDGGIKSSTAVMRLGAAPLLRGTAATQPMVQEHTVQTKNTPFALAPLYDITMPPAVHMEPQSAFSTSEELAVKMQQSSLADTTIPRVAHPIINPSTLQEDSVQERIETILRANVAKPPIDAQLLASLGHDARPNFHPSTVQGNSTKVVSSPENSRSVPAQGRNTLFAPPPPLSDFSGTETDLRSEKSFKKRRKKKRFRGNKKREDPGISLLQEFPQFPPYTPRSPGSVFTTEETDVGEVEDGGEGWQCTVCNFLTVSDEEWIDHISSRQHDEKWHQSQEVEYRGSMQFITPNKLEHFPGGGGLEHGQAVSLPGMEIKGPVGTQKPTSTPAVQGGVGHALHSAPRVVRAPRGEYGAMRTPQASNRSPLTPSTLSRLQHYVGQINKSLQPPQDPRYTYVLDTSTNFLGQTPTGGHLGRWPSPPAHVPEPAQPGHFCPLPDSAAPATGATTQVSPAHVLRKRQLSITPTAVAGSPTQVQANKRLKRSLSPTINPEPTDSENSRIKKSPQQGRSQEEIDMELVRRMGRFPVLTDRGDGGRFQVRCNLCKTEIPRAAIPKHCARLYHRELEAEMEAEMRRRAAGEASVAAEGRVAHMFFDNLFSS